MLCLKMGPHIRSNHSPIDWRCRTIDTISQLRIFSVLFICCTTMNLCCMSRSTLGS